MTALTSADPASDASRIARIATLLCIPVPPLMAFLIGTPLVPVLVPTLIFGAIALASAKSDPKLRPLLLTAALIGICIVFTAAFAGHPWQLDTHMVYFAALAIIATTESLVALALAVALIAVHHLSFGYFLPALVYPSSSVLENLGRTVLHALIVLFEAAVLFLSIRFAAKAKHEVEVARTKLRHSSHQATKAREAAERARERALQAAEQTRHEGRQAAVAVEEISAAARQVASNSSDSQKLVSRARVDAETSGAIIARTKDAMAAIRDSSDQISRMVELIDEIARRTDLLALNAAVESARAGDAGRGFAVVANEVRKLAQQSADATLQIRTLVKASAGRVQEGADLVNETGIVLARIVGSVSDIDERMRDIAVGAAEQSTGLDLVNVAINRIDAITVDDEADAETGADIDDAAQTNDSFEPHRAAA